jgi:ribose transport system substrate-binding protein
MRRRRTKRRPHVAFAAALLVLALALFVGACGDDDDDGGSSDSGGSSDDVQAEATDRVEAAKAVPEFTLEAEPVDVAAAQGKTIFNIPIASSIPYVVGVDNEMKQIAEENGVEFIEFNNEGTPTEWASGMEQAIDRGVDLINLQAAPDPTLLVPQLKAAKEAGIPVTLTHLYQDGTEPPPEVADLLAATVTVPFDVAARLSVDFAIMEDGCDVTPLIITSDEVSPSDGIVAAMEDQFAQNCPDVQAEVINVPVVDWGTKIQPEVVAALQANPDMNWVLPIYDSMSLPASAGIQQSQRDVKIATYNGTPEVMQLLLDGDIVVAEQGENINWLAWANMDQIFRVLTNGPVIEDGNEKTPIRTFDDSNIQEAVGDDGAVAPNLGYGDAYVEGYEGLWGVN